MMLQRRFVLLTLLGAAVALAGAVPAQAAGRLCRLAISGNDLMQYDKMDMTAAADCAVIQVVLTHTGKLNRAEMGHNWVLVASADLEAVANAGAAAGFANNYLQPGDPRIIAATRLIGGGESATVTFPASRLKRGVSYAYLCTYPGHHVMMHGRFHFGS